MQVDEGVRVEGNKDKGLAVECVKTVPVLMETGDDSMAMLETESQVTDPISSWMLDSPAKDMYTEATTMGIMKELEVLGKVPTVCKEGVEDATMTDLQEEVRLSLLKSKRTRTVPASPSATTRKRAATASAPVRKSSRNGGAVTIPVMERAHKLTVEKNVETGTSFSALGTRSDAQLSSVIQDSCLIFNSSVGSVSEILSLVRAKENAQAALAETAFRKEQLAASQAAREAAASASGSREVDDGADTSAPSGEPVAGAAMTACGRAPQGMARKPELCDSKVMAGLDDDIWDIKFNFPSQDNLERKLSRSDITVWNLLSLIESYGYGIRDNMYYVKEKGRGVEGMELIDSMGKIVEMLALNEAEQVVNITVLKKNSVWPAGFNMEADEAEVLDVPVKFSVDNNGVNYISENEEFVPVAIDLTDVLYVGTQQSCNVPKGMQVPVDIMSDDEDAFFYPCQYNLEERNRLVAEEYELMHKLKRQKKEKEPDEEVVQIMHKLDEERKRRSNPAMHYEGDTDVEEIYEEEEEESDGDEAPELEYFEKEYSFEKKQPLNPGPTSRSHYETLEYQCEDFVPSSDEDNSPGDVGDSDDDGFTKKHKLPCGRKRKLKKLKKRVWYDPHRADAHLQFCKKLCFKDVYEFRVALRNYHIAQFRISTELPLTSAIIHFTTLTELPLTKLNFVN
ncbi:hypothetical protein ACQ4PT_039188 [Festuca glaucescens]